MTIALISLSGVLSTVLITLWVEHRVIQLELKKLLNDVKVQLISKKLSTYPDVYRNLSLFAKLYGRKTVTCDELKQFLSRHEELDAKHAIYFGKELELRSYDLLKTAQKVIDKERAEVALSAESLRLIDKCIQAVEIGMKHELGARFFQSPDDDPKGQLTSTYFEDLSLSEVEEDLLRGNSPDGETRL